jgi:hypothetical protein
VFRRIRAEDSRYRGVFDVSQESRLVQSVDGRFQIRTNRARMALAQGAYGRFR